MPATRIAEELGNKMAANVVMLGYLVAATGIVTPDSVEQAVRSTLKPSILDMNLQALETGMQLAKEHAAA